MRPVSYLIQLARQSRASGVIGLRTQTLNAELSTFNAVPCLGYDEYTRGFQSPREPKHDNV